jgi:two-component system, sensor histidine kinase
MCQDHKVTSKSETTVLIVEDERIVALDLRRTLLHHGYRVVATAATGEDAVHLAREFHPRVVLMDMRLRGALDGIGTARRLRLELDFALIYLSGLGCGADAELTHPVANLVKPFTDWQLLAAMEEAEKSLRLIPGTAPSPTNDPSSHGSRQ